MTRKSWAAVGASALLALAELALLTSFARQSIEGAGGIAFLLGLLFANLLPYVLLVAGAIGGLDCALDWAGARVRRPAILVAALTGLVAVPYGIWLAAYTFSGAHASGMKGRALFMAVETVLVAGGFAMAALFAAWRVRSRRLAGPLALALLALALLFTWAGQNFHPNRYEPLHALLGIWALIFAWFGVRELLPAPRQPGPGASRAAIVGLALLIGALAAQLVSHTREGLAWIVWSETPISRYVTHRLGLPASGGEGDLVLELTPVEPEVENESTRAGRAERRAAPAPNIVMFFIDNVQADRVGAYGYTRHPSTPNFDALAERGVLFERAYASYPQTRSFTSALLLGRFVPTIRSLEPPASFTEQSTTRLLKEERDYHIFVQGWFEASSLNTFDPDAYRIDNFSLAPRDDDPRRKGPWPVAPMEPEFEKILVHLDEARDLGQPAFVWVHIIRPHWTPQGRLEGSADFPFGDDLEARYASAIAHCDAWIPRVEQALRRALPERETVWILGSDHGAGLGRFDKMVGKTIYDVHAKVPFLIVAPGIEPRRVSTPVDVALDAAATMLDLAGIEPPPDYDGTSLVSMMQGAAPVERPILINHRGERYKGVVYREWKLIRTQDASTLFNIVDDPEERMNLAGKHPGIVRQLTELIDTDLAERLDAYHGQ